MTRPFAGECPDDRLLLLHALGLVEEEEEDRLEQHIGSCERCGPRLQALRPGERPAGFESTIGHVPPALLSRWPGIRSSLPGPAVLAVERHLSGCGECAEDLARLEQLRQTPIVESDESVPRSSRRGFFLLGGYATLATAAAIVFALIGPLTRGTPAPTPASRPPVESSPVPVEPSTQIEGSAGGEPSPSTPGDPPPDGRPMAPAPAWQVRLLPREPRLLTSVLRGDEGSVPTVRPGLDPGTLVVRVEPVFSVAEDTPITIEIRSGDQRVLARTRARWADLHGGATVFLSRGEARLPAGRYVLRVRAGGDRDSGVEEEAIDYPFAVSP